MDDAENVWIPLRAGLSDKKEYVYTTLNGLEILMISSLNLKQSNVTELVSAAALVVQTGSFNDPDDIQGLSHYLEHMIFMGSEKYPGENEYDVFVTSHGGSCNAFTENEYTLYSFDIPQQYFFGALDIFANCFISPLLSPSSSEREILAIENEFHLALTSDDSRTDDLLAQLAIPSHFLHKFSWGNLESLKNLPSARGVDITTAMRDYFQRYYFPENSKLVVLAPFPIQTIYNGIVSSFMSWKRCANHFDRIHVSFSPPFPDQPFLLRNVPIEKRSHTLKILWTLPSTLADYQSKSHEYLSHLIGHEGKGSVISALKDLHLAHEIIAGVGTSGVDCNSCFSLFSVTIELTTKGVLLWTRVIKVLFQYISFLRVNGLKEYIFQENQQLSRLQYDYEDEVEPEDLIAELAASMTSGFQIPPHDLLKARHLTCIWDTNGIIDILNLLTPRNCHIILSSSLFPEVDDHDIEDGENLIDSESETDDSDESYEDDSIDSMLSSEEESDLLSQLPPGHLELSKFPIASDYMLKSIHFRMSYWKDRISEDLLLYWEDQEISLPGTEGLLHLPPPNRYIPNDLKVHKTTKCGIPEVLFCTSNVRVWHTSDCRFPIPKAVVTISLLSDYLLQSTSHESEVSPSPMIAVYNDVLSRLVNEFLLQELYLAEMAYLESKIVSQMNGIVITVYGFHDKILSLSSLIFRSLFENQLYSNETSIDILVEKLKKEYQNDSLLSADAANTKRLEVLLPHQVPKQTRLHYLNQFSQSKASFVTSLKKYVKCYLESSRCEVFMYGNISPKDSISFGKTVNRKIESGRKKVGSKEKSSKTSKLFHQPLPVFVREISQTSSIIVSPRSEYEDNVCLQVYFQISLNCPRNSALLQLIQRMMEEPLFNELRTQKQLGYDISCFYCETYSKLGYTIEVISSSHALNQIREDVFNFIYISFFNILKSLSLEDYATYQHAVMSRLEIPPTSLYDAAYEKWIEIEERRFSFHKKRNQLCLLPTLTLNDVLDFYEQHFLESSPFRKMMIIESSPSSNDIL